MGTILCHMDLIHTHTIYFLLVLHSTPSGLFLSASPTTILFDCTILYDCNILCHCSPYSSVITSKTRGKSKRLSTSGTWSSYTPANSFLWRHKQLVRISTLPKGFPEQNLSNFVISIPVPCIFYCFALWPINAQLFHKLSHCCMFRHYRVILRQPVINTLPSYTSISNAAVGNTVYN